MSANDQKPSRYGRVFDDLHAEWAALENGHDLIHPERDLCGGVGPCAVMRRACDLESLMVDALNMRRSES